MICDYRFQQTFVINGDASDGDVVEQFGTVEDVSAKFSGRFPEAQCQVNLRDSQIDI